MITKDSYTTQRTHESKGLNRIMITKDLYTTQMTYLVNGMEDSIL